MAKRWILPPARGDEVTRLARTLRISELTAGVLLNRGLSEPEGARRFLQPSLQELADPAECPALVDAAQFLLDAVGAGRKLAIYGDYDADGVCAAALLLRCFRLLGAEARVYIPHRINEGYGLSREALQELRQAGAEVVITVDCGVTAAEEALFARRIGLDLVITDHHEPAAQVPPAAHVLDPKLPGWCSGYRELAGVGVAFKLAWAIGQRLGRGGRVPQEFRDLLIEMLALVAVGTVADVVPLLDENRVLAHHGLKALAASASPGLAALMTLSRVRPDQVDAWSVAFRLAPRLNAAGRMGDASAAVEMLTTDQAAHASDLAEHIEEQNRQRIKAQGEAIREAEAMLERRPELMQRSCLVLSSPDWHQGVVGLVASRLAERFWRPTFVFVTNGETACGSGRSIPGFPLFEAVRRCQELLLRYGGHAGAAGCTLPVENLPAFAERMDRLAAEKLGPARAEPQLAVDDVADLAELNPYLVRELEMLAPFGQGNPRPLFCASGLRVVGNPRTVGSNSDHLVFMVRQGDAVLRVMAPRRAHWLDQMRARKGCSFELAFRPRIDTYRGYATVELLAEDIRWAEADS